jgi:ribosome-associated protein
MGSIVTTSSQLLSLVLAALEGRKAIEVTALDVRALTDITDYMVVASGRSNRQVIAIAEHLIAEAKHHKHAPMGTEGLRHGEWVLVDLCDVIVHVMLPETRAFYQLEKLWADRESTEAASGTQTAL